MIPRQSAVRLLELLGRFPAVVLVGPRQVGKTTLARALTAAPAAPATYLDLEMPSDRAKLQDPELYFAAQEDRLVVLDEIQRAPDLFPVLRGIIDRRRRKGLRTGQFLILGSASVDLLKQSAETLAGRVAYLELTPLALGEVADGDADRLWLRGGFPDSFLAADDAASVDWRRAFIRTYLELDIPQLGPRIPAETLRRFWTMLAHQQGQTVNAARLAGGLGVSGQTVGRYLDLLVDLLLVRQLRPWSRNVGKRLTRSPKVYVRDSGLAHALLGLAGLDDVLAHPVAGPSWEGFVIENALSAAPEGTQAWFYRTSAGAEIDLVLEPPAGDPLAIEIKRSSAPTIGKGFRIACDDIGASRRWIVHAGSSRYPIDAETTAIPLLGLGAALRELSVGA
jgi:predicted AAA+ superfamily ATPase